MSLIDIVIPGWPPSVPSLVQKSILGGFLDLKKEQSPLMADVVGLSG